MAKRMWQWPKASPTDARVAGLMVLAALLLAGRGWLADNPQHDPWAPLDLRNPTGWATGPKLAKLRDDPQECRATLKRSDVRFSPLQPTGEGRCQRDDRLVLDDTVLSPANAQVTCGVAAGLVLWIDQKAQSIAEEALGTRIAQVEQIGTYSCRRMYGRDTGQWSEHATGNAIDIAGFTMEDGRQIEILRDWNGNEEESLFLRSLRDAACESFGTVLSPDYNAAHADHFHLDQGRSPNFGVCR